MMKSKPNSARRRRAFHSFVYRIARPAARFIIRKYPYEVRNTPSKEVFDKPFIILSNHVSAIDMAFMITALPHQAYFVATEDIFCNGFKSRAMRKLFDPIPLFKPDVSAVPVLNVLRRVREGSSIIMYPEGHHSPDGRTTDIKETVGALVKSARCQLITFRMVNGFFFAPRWCASFRRGPVRGEYIGVYSPEELSKMTAEEITEIIKRDLYEDAYARQKSEGAAPYKSDRRAETLEAHFYICPHCNAQSRIHSHGNTFHCDACGNHAEVDEYCHLKAVDGSAEFPFETFTEWADWQREQEAEFIENFEGDGAVYRDEGLHLIEYCIDTAETRRVTDTCASADFEGFTVDALDLRVNWSDLPWLNYNQGGRGFQFVCGDHHYELWGETFCAARYGNLYFRHRSGDGKLNIRY